MKQLPKAIFVLATGCLFSVVQAGDFYIYPSKGQSQQQQQTDTSECQQWAGKQTGFDPTDLPTAPAPTEAPPGGEVVKGALLGTAIGAITGDTGAGAAYGATAGLLGRMHSRRSAARREEAAEKQAVNQYAGQRASYDSAYSACLTGRGYTLSPKQ
jgi:hypothetical protein